ncbi:MAG: protein kinase [Deltaproteobacteria bacterium]|nr:protein kinase [Deltaproteobacteria bacterium]
MFLGRILVVDEEEAARSSELELLSSLGYEVWTAAGCKSALQLLDKHRFDLVLTEYDKPGLSGRDLLETIAQAGFDTDVLVWSAHGTIPAAVEAIKLGAKNFLEKPVDPEVLKREVRHVFRERLARRRPSSQAPLPRTETSIEIDLSDLPPKEPRASRFGRYQLVRSIGRGGMGEVFEAFDPQLNREIAIKVIKMKEGTQTRRVVVERFRREAAVAAQLSHPNIAAIYDIESAPGDEELYIVMELVKGASLRSVLEREKSMPFPQTLVAAYQLVDALEYIHRHDVIHRDIKPENIILGTDDQVKIIDFGIAKIRVSDLTSTGCVVGSPSYLAPESIENAEVDFRADQFALATVLVEVLTGRPVFQKSTFEDTVRSIILAQRPPLEELGVIVPHEFERILAKMHARAPGDRFQDERELLARLEALGEPLEIKLSPALPRATTRRLSLPVTRGR